MIESVSRFLEFESSASCNLWTLDSPDCGIPQFSHVSFVFVQRQRDCVADNGRYFISAIRSGLFSSYLLRRALDLAQYRFHSGADLESAHGRRRPFRTFAPGSRARLSFRFASPGALFDNAAPFKSRRGTPCRFQGRHIPRRSVVLAPAYHIGQQSVASNLSDAKPQRSYAPRPEPCRRRRVGYKGGQRGTTGILGHTRGLPPIASTSRKVSTGSLLFLFEICETRDWQR